MPQTSLIALISRHPSLTPSQFRQTYESRHVPLLNSLVAPSGNKPLSYTRNYVSAPSSTVTSTGNNPGNNAQNPLPTIPRGDLAVIPKLDCVTIVTFASEEKMKKFRECINEPAIKEQLTKSEASFMDVKRTTVVVGEEKRG